MSSVARVFERSIVFGVFWSPSREEAHNVRGEHLPLRSSLYGKIIDSYGASCIVVSTWVSGSGGSVDLSVGRCGSGQDAPPPTPPWTF